MYIPILSYKFYIVVVSLWWCSGFNFYYFNHIVIPICIGKIKSFFTRMLIDCTFTWLALHMVDEAMNSITIPLKTETVTVLLLFIIVNAFDNKEKK